MSQYKDFEDFLAMKHAKQFIGTKEGMMENFPDWFEDLDMDTIIMYGDIYAAEVAKKTIDKCHKVFVETLEGVPK